MVLDATKPGGGLEQAEPGPAPNHVAASPALDVARDVAERADEILDTVGGGEEAAQRGRQVELEDGERLLQPFAQARRGVGLAVALQPRGEFAELPARRGRAGGPVGATQTRPDVGLAALRDQGVEVPPL